VRRKRVKGAGPDWAEMLGPKARNNWANVEKSKGKRTGCQNIWAENKIENKWATEFFSNLSTKT
jgi:hypothetical protein